MGRVNNYVNLFFMRISQTENDSLAIFDKHL